MTPLSSDAIKAVRAIRNEAFREAVALIMARHDQWKRPKILEKLSTDQAIAVLDEFEALADAIWALQDEDTTL